MKIKTIVWVVVVAAALIAVYLLLGGGREAVVEEQLLGDVEYLLDDSVSGEVNEALNDALLGVALDKEALAGELSQLDTLPEFSSIEEVEQALVEISQ